MNKITAFKYLWEDRSQCAKDLDNRALIFCIIRISLYLHNWQGNSFWQWCELWDCGNVGEKVGLWILSKSGDPETNCLKHSGGFQLSLFRAKCSFPKTQFPKIFLPDPWGSFFQFLLFLLLHLWKGKKLSLLRFFNTALVRLCIMHLAPCQAYQFSCSTFISQTYLLSHCGTKLLCEGLCCMLCGGTASFIIFFP